MRGWPRALRALASRLQSIDPQSSCKCAEWDGHRLGSVQCSVVHETLHTAFGSYPYHGS